MQYKEKTCTKCKQTKLPEDFNKRSGGKWLMSLCKKCDTIGRRERKEKQLGRKMRRIVGAYTQKEEQKLFDMYVNNYSYADILKEFPGRSQHTIESKLHSMGITKKYKKYRRVQTKAELEVENILIQLEVGYIKEYPISKYVVDFFVNGLIIEVQGAFWHCDPLLFPNGPKYDNQKIIVQKDKNKKELLLSMGYSILYIWETDIKFRKQELIESLQVVLNSNIKEYDRAISVEVLRDDTEINKLITKGNLSS